MDDLIVRKASSRDISTIVAIHLQALEGSLLTRLGKMFLEKTFYPSLLASSQCCVQVATVKEEILGFATYGKTQKVIPTITTKPKGAIILALIRKLVTDPFLAKDCLTASKSEETQTVDDKTAHLAFIATKPTSQSSGVGSLLLQRSLQSVYAEWNVQKVFVETRADRAKNFYMKNGFMPIHEKQRGSTPFYCLKHENLTPGRIE